MRAMVRVVRDSHDAEQCVNNERATSTWNGVYELCLESSVMSFAAAAVRKAYIVCLDHGSVRTIARSARSLLWQFDYD